MANNIFLSVVIPAYKEVDNLHSGVLEKVHDYLKRQEFSWEVIIVDDGSPDDTKKVAWSIIKNWKGFKLMQEPHRGKGGTVIAGILAAKGEIVLFADMDQATPIKEIEKLIPKFTQGYDIVIGSRAGRKNAPIVRKIMAIGFMILRTLILRLPYKDTQCGFKALKGDAAKKVFKKMKVFSATTGSSSAGVTAGFDLEMLYIARKLKLRVAEVPVTWEHKGSIRVNPIKDSWQGLVGLLQVRKNALLRKYKI